MYQNAKAVALLSKGNLVEAKKLISGIVFSDSETVTINNWTVNYDNNVATMQFEIIPNDSSYRVTCCLYGMDTDDKLLASSWVTMDPGSSTFNAILFASEKLPANTQIEGNIFGIISNGKEQSFFNFTGTFEV